MAKPKPLPSQKILKKFFEYHKDGYFIRKISASSKYPKGSIVTGTIKIKQNKQVKFFGVLYMYHRLVWAWHFGKTPDVIDHINVNALDNRIENLRAASIQLNAFNKKRAKNNRSGFRGVYWSAEHGKWRAHISANGKRSHLGLFETSEKASLAYKKAAILKHGRFANYESN